MKISPKARLYLASIVALFLIPGGDFLPFNGLPLDLSIEIPVLLLFTLLVFAFPSNEKKFEAYLPKVLFLLAALSGLKWIGGALSDNGLKLRIYATFPLRQEAYERNPLTPDLDATSIVPQLNYEGVSYSGFRQFVELGFINDLNRLPDWDANGNERREELHYVAVWQSHIFWPHDGIRFLRMDSNLPVKLRVGGETLEWLPSDPPASTARAVTLKKGAHPILIEMEHPSSALIPRLKLLWASSPDLPF